MGALLKTIIQKWLVSWITKATLPLSGASSASGGLSIGSRLFYIANPSISSIALGVAMLSVVVSSGITLSIIAYGTALNPESPLYLAPIEASLESGLIRSGGGSGSGTAGEDASLIEKLTEMLLSEGLNGEPDSDSEPYSDGEPDSGGDPGGEPSGHAYTVGQGDSGENGDPANDAGAQVPEEPDRPASGG